MSQAKKPCFLGARAKGWSFDDEAEPLRELLTGPKLAGSMTVDRRAKGEKS